MATLTSAKYSDRLIDGCPMKNSVHVQVGNVTEGHTLCVKELAANNVVRFLLTRQSREVPLWVYVRMLIPQILREQGHCCSGVA
jgi:hypothetical protein